MEPHNMQVSVKYIDQHLLHFDAAKRRLESVLSVRIECEHGIINLYSDQIELSEAGSVIEKLDRSDFIELDPEFYNISYFVSLCRDQRFESFLEQSKTPILITPKGRSIRSKTIGQSTLIDAIDHHSITFCIGPAGSGKTFLSVAMAVRAFQQKKVSRIILTRPAVEAGERLGFLPGDLQEKVDPYMRPIYDALSELIGNEAFERYHERGLIEVSPLAFMRGRTLDDSFIILDEAQNTTREQMLMFLTRVGMNSKVCVCGDITQVDLPYGTHSGLQDAVQVLSNIADISVVALSESDIVRNPLVGEIILAYNSRRKGESYQ